MSTNLPLLDDKQRQQVGTCYKKHGQKKAVSLGHQLLTPGIREQRLSAWVDFIERYPGSHLMCFRGGLRSQSVQQVLAENGIDLPRVDGGYKSLRRGLLDALQHTVQSLGLLVLAGRTGTGKTRLLHRLPFTVDLEGLARHRGSSFGRILEAQPTTATFENAVTIELMTAHQQQVQHLNHSQPLVLEDEARLIGRVAMPEILKDKLAISPAVVLEESIDVRIRVAKADYVDELSDQYCKRAAESSNALLDSDICRHQGLAAFADYHRNSLYKIRKRLGGDSYKKALALFEHGFAHHAATGGTDAYNGFISYLLQTYYDPMYDYQMTRKSRTVVFRGNANSILEWYSNAGYISSQQPVTDLIQG